MKPFRRYRGVSTSTLRASIAVLSKPGLSWLFSDQLAAMEHELLMRDLQSIADDSGAHLVAAIVGLQ